MNYNDRLNQLFPCLSWLPELKQPAVLRADVLAGISVAMLLIPQAMAYAHLAGLPTEMGLYASFIPIMVAVVFGSSRFLSTGPVPVTSLLTAVTLIPLAVTGSSDYIKYALLLALLAGIIQIVLGFLRFGVVVNFLSYPVFLGFMHAIALIIAAMQLSGLTGLTAIPAKHYYETVIQVFHDMLSCTHWPTVGMATIALAIMLIGARMKPKAPHILIAVVVTTLLSWLTGFEQLETINIHQIISPAAKRLLINNQSYPQEHRRLLKQLSHDKKKLDVIRAQEKKFSTEYSEAIDAVNQTRWQLERSVLHHAFELGEINRFRFKRVMLHGKVRYIANDQKSTRINGQEPLWRLKALPNNDSLVVQSGGNVVGAIPSGLPALGSVPFNWDLVSALFVSAFVIAIVGFAESTTIAKQVAIESRQRLDLNQELIGQGLAKCVGSFFHAMPVSGAFVRTVINYKAGAKTGFSSIVAGLVVMCTLLWFTPLFYHLPYATLAAVIMVAVLKMINFREMWRIWQMNRNEGIVMVLTFFLTLALAPQIAQALVLGMLLSLGLYLFETMRPHVTKFRPNEAGDDWVEEDPEARSKNMTVSVLRFDGVLYFANAAYFEEEISKHLAANPKLKQIILDCTSITKLDASALQTVHEICNRLQESGVCVHFSRVRKSVLSRFKTSGLYEQLGPDAFYKTSKQALSPSS